MLEFGGRSEHVAFDFFAFFFELRPRSIPPHAPSHKRCGAARVVRGRGRCPPSPFLETDKSSSASSSLPDSKLFPFNPPRESQSSEFQNDRPHEFHRHQSHFRFIRPPPASSASSSTSLSTLLLAHTFASSPVPHIQIQTRSLKSTCRFWPRASVGIRLLRQLRFLRHPSSPQPSSHLSSCSSANSPSSSSSQSSSGLVALRACGARAKVLVASASPAQQSRRSNFGGAFVGVRGPCAAPSRIDASIRRPVAADAGLSSSSCSSHSSSSLYSSGLESPPSDPCPTRLPLKRCCAGREWCARQGRCPQLPCFPSRQQPRADPTRRRSFKGPLLEKL